MVENVPDSFTGQKGKWSLKYTFKNDTIVNVAGKYLSDEKSKLTSSCLFYEIGVARYLKFCPIFGQT